jgi:hypothetical protein
MNRFFMLTLLCAVGCARPGDPRLDGTFVSDEQATVDYLKANNVFVQDRPSLYYSMPTWQVTYDGPRLVTVLPAGTVTGSIVVLEKGPDYVVIEEITPDDTNYSYSTRVVTTNRIEFTDDGYWMSLSIAPPGFKWKFIRKD